MPKLYRTTDTFIEIKQQPDVKYYCKEVKNILTVLSEWFG